MSIRLYVDDYCGNCSRFKAYTEKLDHGDGKCSTVITCKNRYTCEKIAAHIYKVVAEEKAKENADGSVRTNDNRCILCGEIIPEGSLVCAKCSED